MSKPFNDWVRERFNEEQREKIRRRVNHLIREIWLRRLGFEDVDEGQRWLNTWWECNG